MADGRPDPTGVRRALDTGPQLNTTPQRGAQRNTRRLSLPADRFITLPPVLNTTRQPQPPSATAPIPSRPSEGERRSIRTNSQAEGIASRPRPSPVPAAPPASSSPDRPSRTGSGGGQSGRGQRFAQQRSSATGPSPPAPSAPTGQPSGGVAGRRARRAEQRGTAIPTDTASAPAPASRPSDTARVAQRPEGSPISTKPPGKTPAEAKPTSRPSSAYIIRRGDTLSGIAARLGTTVEELAALNGIEDPDLIYAGKVLRLPGNSNLMPTPRRRSA